MDLLQYNIFSQNIKHELCIYSRTLNKNVCKYNLSFCLRISNVKCAPDFFSRHVYVSSTCEHEYVPVAGIG